MRVVADSSVVEHVRAAGGSVYVWPQRIRCCGGAIELRASTTPSARVFRRVDDGGELGIDLHLAAGMAEPESLHLEVTRRGAVRAFWNGLAWVA
jgi:hypothetical protein